MSGVGYFPIRGSCDAGAAQLDTRSYSFHSIYGIVVFVTLKLQSSAVAIIAFEAFMGLLYL